MTEPTGRRMTVGGLHARLTELLAGDPTLAGVPVVMEGCDCSEYAGDLEIEELHDGAGTVTGRELYLSRITP